MNGHDCIGKLLKAGFEAHLILDELIRSLSENDAKKFYDYFVRVHGVTFKEEDEPPTLADLIAQSEEYRKRQEEKEKSRRKLKRLKKTFPEHKA